jgi:CRISPR-associated exonuclease Cas4
MLDVHVPAGSLYYGKKRRRLEVDFDQKLRTLTRETATALHDMLAAGRTPPPLLDSSRCDNCSFVEICLPRTTGSGRTVADYLQRMTGEPA